MIKPGSRTAYSPFKLLWTVVELPNRSPPPDRCCLHCSPLKAAEMLLPTDPQDPRLAAYASDFIFPLVCPPSRPTSVASQVSIATSSTIVRTSKDFKVPAEQREQLRSLLLNWREARWVERGAPSLISSSIVLPTAQLNALVNSCERFLTQSSVTASLV